MNENALWAIFPFVFVAAWLAVTVLLNAFSGWATLSARFPDRAEPRLKRIWVQSGKLGKGTIWNPWGGVSYGNCLRFDICQTGFRVAVWRIFGPFSKPFFVPWDKISVELKTVIGFRFYRLSFGAQDLSSLTIGRRLFKRIASFGLLKVDPSLL